MNEFETKPISEAIFDQATRNKIGKMQKTGFYHSNKWFIWAIVLALAIIGVLVYLVFFTQPQMATEPAKVSMVIESPDQVSSGGEVVYRIVLENQDAKALAPGKIELVLPPGGKYVQSTPPALNGEGTLYPVPELVPGQNTVIFTKIKLQGDVGDSKKITAKYFYRFVGLSSEFVKESEGGILLGASDVSIDLDGPGVTNSSQIVVYTVKYRNNSDKPLSAGRIQLTYPNGFDVSGVSPDADVSSNTWAITNLGKNQDFTITVRGSYSKARGGEVKTLKADLLILGTTGNYFNQGSKTFSTTITDNPLVVELEKEGSQAQSAKPGENLNYTVRYSNTSNKSALGVNIQVKIDSKAVDLSSLASEDGIISGNTITWNASSKASLENLEPNSTGEFRFGFSIKNPPVKDGSKNLEVTLSSQITSQEYSTPFLGNSVNLKIASVTNLTPDVSYTSGSPTPKVGSLTTYTVNFSIKNTSSDLTDGIFTAFVAIDPKSFDRASLSSRDLSNLKFDPSTGKITWTVGNIPAGSGSFVPSKNVSFKLNLTPVPAQANKQVVLMKNIAFTANDSFTKEKVNLSLENITTQDVDNGQNGIVEP